MNDVISGLEGKREIGFGFLGYGFAARAHISALKRIREVYWPPPALPRCIALCGRSEDRLNSAADRFEIGRRYTNWREMLDDKDMHVFDNCATNDVHADSCIEAAKRGLHIICEKPMARNSEEAGRMLEAVKENEVKHMCGFNYRFIPAVRLAKELVDKGVIGEIYHFYGRYAVDRAMDPDIPLRWIYQKSLAGSGALGALGSHLIDLARFLVGEPANVMANAKTFIKKRKKIGSDELGEVTVDDAVSSLIEFKNGAIGNFETSRFCPGRKNYQSFELNGSKGSIVFNVEKMNRLQVYLKEESVPLTTGFHDVIVTEPEHTLFREWWPTGHTLGWDHTFIHELNHFLEAVANDVSVEPYGATLEDGYRNVVICDAMLKSAEVGRRIEIIY